MRVGCKCQQARRAVYLHSLCVAVRREVLARMLCCLNQLLRDACAHKLNVLLQSQLEFEIALVCETLRPETGTK